MKPENRYFNHAHEAWCGEKYEWKDENGNQQHPMDSDDEKLKAFYQGFLYAKRGHKDLLNRIKQVEYLERQIDQCKKEYRKYFQK